MDPAHVVSCRVPGARWVTRHPEGLACGVLFEARAAPLAIDGPLYGRGRVINQNLEGRMRSISESVHIGAPAPLVWAALVDLARYPAWNPFIREAAGVVEVGNTLRLKLFPEHGRATKFTPRVLVAEPGVELRWIGRVLLPGVFDGEHSFTLTPGGDGGTDVVQAETFSGLLTPFLGSVIEGTRADFVALNEALKKYVENR